MNKLIKKIIKTLSPIILAVLFMAQAMMFRNQYSYAYHIEQAEESLAELSVMMSKNGLQASIISAHDPKNELDLAQISNLIEKIVYSTEYAIENADDIKSASELKKAITKITDLQNKEVKFIANVIKAVKNESAKHHITLSLNKLIELREKLDNAKLEVQEALKNNQETIEINIPTDHDKKPHGKHDLHKKEEKNAHKVAMSEQNSKARQKAQHKAKKEKKH